MASHRQTTKGLPAMPQPTATILASTERDPLNRCRQLNPSVDYHYNDQLSKRQTDRQIDEQQTNQHKIAHLLGTEMDVGDWHEANKWTDRQTASHTNTSVTKHSHGSLLGRQWLQNLNWSFLVNFERAKPSKNLLCVGKHYFQHMNGTPLTHTTKKMREYKRGPLKVCKKYRISVLHLFLSKCLNQHDIGYVVLILAATRTIRPPFGLLWIEDLL